MYCTEYPASSLYSFAIYIAAVMDCITRWIIQIPVKIRVYDRAFYTSSFSVYDIMSNI